MPTLSSYPELRNLDESPASRGIIEGIIEHLQATQAEPKNNYSPQEQAAYVLNRLKFYAEVESNSNLHINDFLNTEALKEEYNSLEVLRNPKATAAEKKKAFAGLEGAQLHIEKALDILGITNLVTTEEIAAVNILVNLDPAVMQYIGDIKSSYREDVLKEAHKPPQLSQEFIDRYNLTAAKVKAYQDSIRVFRGSITDETIKALGKETFEYKSINPLALIVVLATAMRYGATNMDGVHLVPVTQIVFGHETYTGYRRLADAISNLKVTPADIADRMAKTAGNGNKFGHLDLFSLKMLESIPEDDKEILDQIKAETPKRIKQVEAIGHAPIEKARLESMLDAANNPAEYNKAIILKLRETLANVKLHAKIIGYTALEGLLQNSLEDIEEGSEEEISALRALAADIQEKLKSGEPIEEIEVEEEEDNEDEQGAEAGLEIEGTDGEEAQEEENDQANDVDNDEEQDDRNEAGEDSEVDSDQEEEEQEEEDDDDDDDDEEEEENDEDEEDEEDNQEEATENNENGTVEGDAEGDDEEDKEGPATEDNGGDSDDNNENGPDEQEEDDDAAVVEGHSADGNEDDDDDELAGGGGIPKIVPEEKIDEKEESTDIERAISESGLTLLDEVKDQIKNLFIWSRTEGPTTSIAYCLHVISDANANEFINYQDKNGNTPLMLAAKNSHDDMVKLLLKNGASSSLTNKQGKTALALAQESEARLQAQREKVAAALELQKANEPAGSPANKQEPTVKELIAAKELAAKQANKPAEALKDTKTETQKLEEECQSIDKALAANSIIEQDLTKAMQEARTKDTEEGQKNPPSMVDGGATEGAVAKTKAAFENTNEKSAHLDNKGRLHEGSDNGLSPNSTSATDSPAENPTQSSKPTKH